MTGQLVSAELGCANSMSEDPIASAFMSSEPMTAGLSTVSLTSADYMSAELLCAM